MTTIAWINHAVMRLLKASSTKSALIHQSLNNGPVQKKTVRDAMTETREPDRGSSSCLKYTVNPKGKVRRVSTDTVTGQKEIATV